MKKVKFYFYIFLFLAVVIMGLYLYHYLIGFTPARQNEIKHVKSDIIGLKRVVEQYDCNGNVINRYEGRYKIEIEGGFVSFTHQGKNIKLSGTIQIREVD
ncbi:hypothetical protein JW935_10975 [candidate division KSB1 bacterium]|nr:hypothetical protein [candidate division KSB1 bacterium]